MRPTPNLAVSPTGRRPGPFQTGVLALALGAGLPAACGDDGGGPPAADCTGLEDRPATGGVVFRFVNATEVPVYLPPSSSCNTTRVDYFLRDAEGLLLNAEEAPCEGSCQQRAEAPGQACNDSCLVGPIRRLEPGAVFEHTWDGGLWISDRVSPSCLDGDGASPQSSPQDAAVDADHVECLRRERAEPGSYTITLDVLTDCATPSGAGCACAAPDPSGVCDLPTDVLQDLRGSPLSAAQVFDPSAGGVVEVRFEGDVCTPLGMPCDEVSDECCDGEVCALDDATSAFVCTLTP